MESSTHESQLDPREIAMRILVLNFTAIHTSSMVSLTIYRVPLNLQKMHSS